MNKTLDSIAIHTTALIPKTGPEFGDFLQKNACDLSRNKTTELQINLGKLCNLACHHCHVDAGPKRTEIMRWEVMKKILAWIDTSEITRVDLTGGAPELNPHFRRFCEQLLKRGVHITSRCNITVLFEPGQENLAQWYADKGIHLVCSLPCYREDNVDAQRGKGTFEKSIKGLRLLNRLGYGEDPELILDLVYNPNGAFLPPDQSELEQDYRHFLETSFGVKFSSLLTITNVPINRFAHALHRDKELDSYQDLLVNNFNASTVDALMCRQLLNIDWTGQVFDCDFNQMLELPYSGSRTYLWDISTSVVSNEPIQTDRHCFACTAGAGSSCGGALTDL